MQSRELESRARELMREVVSRKDTTGAQLLREVNAYLRQCFKRESPPHVSELAGILGFSVSGLSRKFRGSTGTNLSSCFKDQQVACAQRLLRLGRLSISRVGRKAGFGTRRTFYRAFRQRTGMTPSEYRTRIASLRTA